MKKIYLTLIAACSLVATSCNAWLDVLPSDIVEQEQLFKEGDGYRNALNGVYKQLASDAMFGRELTWGAAETMAQGYYNYGFSGSMGTWKDFSEYEYTKSGPKGVIRSLWETAYKAIANCNNLIDHIQAEADNKFRGGKMEKDLILGEALALRGFIHFQVLCYFAPAPVKQPTENWIPYYETFTTMPANYVTVEAALEKCIRDMKQGQALVEPFDSYISPDGREDHTAWMEYLPRFFGDSNIDGAIKADDIFYAFRGYRMNRMAIAALLARIYAYAGKLDDAVIEAQKVIECTGRGGRRVFEFSTKAEAQQDYKMSKDLVFALSNTKLIDNYLPYSNTGSMSLMLPMGSFYPQLFPSWAGDDYRGTTALVYLGTSGRYPMRWSKPQSVGTYTMSTLDMIPIVRMSEMHLIQAEYHASKGDYVSATAAMETVRLGRNCDPDFLYITDARSFQKELLNEARREFMTEGLVFYYFKRFGAMEANWSPLPDEKYYFPRPDTETL